MLLWWLGGGPVRDVLGIRIRLALTFDLGCAAAGTTLRFASLLGGRRHQQELIQAT